MKTSNESPPGRREWIGFGCMLVQQAQNAFNDKMAQFLLIPLAGAVGFMIPLGAGREMDVESAAGIMIALPFVLFAPLAGWLSDRFSKRDVMLGSALLQLAVLLMICLAVANRILGLALVGFFFLAIQSAIFSPAKIGMNKELLGTRHLGMAAGVQQMLAILAILGGQVVAGWWFDERLRGQHGQAVDAWWAASGPLWILTLSALPALLLAWLIPRVPAQGKAPFNARVAISHFVHLRDLWQVPALRSCALGIAFFWGMAAWINLWSVKLARELTGGGEGFGTVSSIFMAAASVGMAIGFGIAAIFLRRRIELGWVPVSGMAMTLAAVILGFTDPGKAAQYLQIVDSGFIPVGPWPMVELSFLGALAAMAFFSALFLAPINAWIQDHYPADKRGEMQAAVNLQDCLAGILAVILVAVIEFSGSAMGLDPMAGFQLQMMLIAAACLLATILMIRAFPAEMIRMLATRLIRVFYHVRAVGSQRIPESGGVLLLPNHVTYADAFYLSAASPRPIRFVMDDVFAANAAIQWFTRLFDTVNIKREQPMEAIREVISALQQGDVVCLFPEGQLTRTGTLCKLQRGFELIAKKAGCPVMPVWVDGTWGSIFSFERNRFFRKFPRRFGHGIAVAFGKPMMESALDCRGLQLAMMRASTEAVASRFKHHGGFSLMRCSRSPLLADFNSLPAAERARFRTNGHQIGMINGLPRSSVFYMLRDDFCTQLLGLTVAFPYLFRARLELRDRFDAELGASWVGGELLRRAIDESDHHLQHAVFYDFSSRSHEAMEKDGLIHCPSLAVDGIVLAMSMPDPPQADSGLPMQPGHKPGAWGRLLPGWSCDLESVSGQWRVDGPAAPAGGILLPEGCILDDEGFLSPG